MHDHICGNETNFYPPLTNVQNATSAVALTDEFRGDGLDSRDGTGTAGPQRVYRGVQRRRSDRGAGADWAREARVEKHFQGVILSGASALAFAIREANGSESNDRYNREDRWRRRGPAAPVTMTT